MPIPPDMLAAIGEPKTRPTPFADAEIGYLMKVKARELVDSGEIKTEEDALRRFKIRGEWIANKVEVGEDTREYWLKFERACFRSARKYLAELREARSVE